MWRRIVVALALLGLGCEVYADPSGQRGHLAKEDVQRIIQRTMAGFWGRAVGEDGRPIQPATEEERRTLPIPEADAERVVNDAVLYGAALWCEADWKPVHIKYMQVERRKGWSEKQVAFIGVLFGVTQGTISGSMGRRCSSDEKRLADEQLRKESERLRSLLKSK